MGCRAVGGDPQRERQPDMGRLVQQCNNERLHSACGNIPPTEYDEAYYGETFWRANHNRQARGL